ncbi:hypothetical protein C8R45DRAFT_563505 [Mycena sanguinolenta]|nr:hypothetical protein C8R45DRAFT_563505 [Mycena sanguinolenta]
MTAGASSVSASTSTLSSSPSLATSTPATTTTFSFKAPLPPSASSPTATSGAANSTGTNSGANGSPDPAGAQTSAGVSLKQRRVSLALPSSPRLVPAWHFRDDTRVPYAAEPDGARRGKVRRIDTSLADEDDERDREGVGWGWGAGADEEDGDAAPEKEREAKNNFNDKGEKEKDKEKKVRRKWTPEETQMLVDGCRIHGVGNWKAILSDPSLSFQNRSPVDLKDRFRTYFPEAYRTHYPNARTHLPASLARAASPSSHPIASSSSSSLSPSHATTPNAAPSSLPSKPNRSTHADGTPLFPLPSPAHPKRRPFSAEEDSALLAGFRKHGAAWAAIAKDAPVFGLTGRRSMDLRDRFRNAWPGEYERAGYKARPKAGKKGKEKEGKDKEKEEANANGNGNGNGNGKDKMKDEEGDEDEPRGRARVGRAQTDEGLSGVSRTQAVSPSTAGGAVRRRRRAHTSQGFKTMSMPPSVVGSDDEGGGAAVSDFGFGGGATSDFGMSFGRGVGGEFGFRFAAGGAATAKGEETALVGGMRHLDMDEAMPDANAATRDTAAPETGARTPPMPPPPPPPESGLSFQAQLLLHRRAEELTLGMGMHSGTTIGRSAWGTQDWLSANPRLDPSAAGTLEPSSATTATAFSPALRTYSHPHSPPLSSSASFSTPGGELFERAHGVMERYDLEPAAQHLHHHHHHVVPGGGAYAYGSPALSFHSASLSLDHSSSQHFYSQDDASIGHYSSHSLSEAGTRDDDGDAFDEDSSAFSIADSEPGGAASWGGGANGGGGGFRGFTHHSNTAGDLIFGARTHQPIWSGVDAWGGARGRFGAGGRMGLAGIAEAHGGKRGEDGEGDAAAAGGEEEDKLGLFSLDDLVDLSQHDAPEADMEIEMDAGGGSGGGEMQMEPPRTPLLHASPAPTRVVHVHHHHHHHHYTPAVRSVSVPPGEAPEDGLTGLGLPLGLMSAPATPALGAAAILAPPTAFALDPTLLGLSHRGNMNAANTLHTTLMGPSAGGHGHGDGMYDLPFLDLHYFGGGAAAQQMQVEGWRRGEALDLARSTSTGSTATSAAQQSFAPSAFSFAQPRVPQAQAQTVSVSQAQAQAQAGASPPGVWKALGIPASLRQHIPPPRPLMRRASAGPPGIVGTRATGAGAAPSSAVTSPTRSMSHHRGQSAVVRPQDLVLSPEATPTSSGSKGKRKRASWDGGGW